MVAPVVDEIAQQYDGQVKVVKLNTDENPNVASQYGIRSIPTLMILRVGKGLIWSSVQCPRQLCLILWKSICKMNELKNAQRAASLS
jgi:thioredoxin-like negative regulator of GroEL